MTVSQEPDYFTARHFEWEGRTAEALQVYEAIAAEPGAADDPFRASAKKRAQILRGNGSFGDRFEARARHFFQEATDPRTLIPMLLAGTVFQASRAALMGSLLRSPASGLTRGLGAKSLGFALPFGAEVSTFVAAGHGLSALLSSEPRPTAPFAQEWASTAIALGLLKFFHPFATSLSRPFPQQAQALASKTLGATALVGGLYAAGRLEESLGWREKSDASNAFFDAASSAAALSLGARLSQRLLGGKLSAPLQEWEIRLQESRLRPPLVESNLAMAGKGKATQLWMVSSGSGSGAAESKVQASLLFAKRLTQAHGGQIPYMMLDFRKRLGLMKPEEVSELLHGLDKLINISSPAQRKTLLPAWWETLHYCDATELQTRATQYGFWLKHMPVEEIPSLARAMLDLADRLQPAQFNRLAALSLKRTLKEGKRGLEYPIDWVADLFLRLSKPSQASFLKSLRAQMKSEDLGLSRNALDMIAILGPRLGTEKLFCWTQELLIDLPRAVPWLQTTMWRSAQRLWTHVPATERGRLSPALFAAVTAAEHGHHPSPFIFQTLGQALEALDPPATNLLVRQLLLHLPDASPGLAKGLLLTLPRQLERLDGSNRMLLIQQWKNLFDSSDPLRRSTLFNQMPNLRNLWDAISPQERSELTSHWGKKLADGEGEAVLHQAENLLFTLPSLDTESRADLLIKLDTRTRAPGLPPDIRRGLSQRLQAISETLPLEDKISLVSAFHNQGSASSPFPLAGYLWNLRQPTEHPGLAQALGMKAGEWPDALPIPIVYARELQEWQSQIIEVTSRDTEKPQLQPIAISLSDVLPYHFITHDMKPGEFLQTIEGIRGRIFRTLVLEGWRPGQVPSEESLRRAITSTELGIPNFTPLVANAGASGTGLLLNGHHRVSSLITLVADGLLPQEVLRAIPFERVGALSSQAILQEALGPSELPDFGWKDVLAFHPPSLILLERLGYHSTLRQGFSSLEAK